MERSIYGGLRKCIVIKKRTRVEEVQKMVTIGNHFFEQKLWYCLKYDRKILIAIEGMRMLKRRAQKAGASCKGRTLTYNHGVVCTRSGRDGYAGLQEVLREMVLLTERGGCVGDHTLRLGEEITELSDDDEISTALDDVSDEKTLTEGVKKAAKEAGVKMDKHKQDILKWKNGLAERIEQKLADTYKKMGCITQFDLGEYSVKLSRSGKLVVKLGQQTYTSRQWKMQGLPCCHALSVIRKETYGRMTMYVQFIRARPNNSYTTSWYIRWKHTTMEKLMGRYAGWLVGKSLKTSMPSAYYPRTMTDNPVGLCLSTGSRKRRIQNLRGAQNTAKLDIRGAPVAIPMPILMHAMNAILCRLKIYWMVCMFQCQVGRKVVLYNFGPYMEKLVPQRCKRCSHCWCLRCMLSNGMILAEMPQHPHAFFFMLKSMFAFSMLASHLL
ncbi:LOW QUALITY PROTEIN: hypothetical protein Cgig2_002924 [Carnegiea gigantea]|uniref:Transposase n=1 Tax=Carnegiea gigantea TaxID=171969 RepID=A0A9Q1JL97_9CARY|nr:LOW QUALITY PROTEIN: hypothetical protein Cgig2_002924 [Carnegiea gigantea]